MAAFPDQSRCLVAPIALQPCNFLPSRLCVIYITSLVWIGCRQEIKRLDETVFKQVISATCMACLVIGATPVTADPDAGAYLAARQADNANDFSVSTHYLAKALQADPTNIVIAENAMRSLIALGQIDRAEPIARAMVAQGNNNLIATLTLSIVNAKAGNWSGILEELDTGHSISPLVDGLSRAWAHLGEDDMTRAIDSFDAVIASEGMAAYGLPHKAYALASVGDFEGAEAIFRDNSSLRFSRQSVIAYAQILSQLGQNETAVAFMDRIFSNQLDPGLTLLRAELAAGNSVAYSAVRTPVQGMADLFLLIASILQDDAPDAFTLLYARAANHLWPENTQAVLTTARLLESLAQYNLANATYTQVDPSDAAFLAAELGRAEVLRSADRPDAAIEVLEALSRSYPERPEVFAAKGDNLRQAERFEDAIEAYSRALPLYDDNNTAKWFVYYARGISHHQLDQWSGAEVDFRAALELRPEQPQVLNYLGYSLVERGEKMDEALAMIETAAEARPDNGAIVDSLGWVYFQLGRYDEAVVHLEQAASLEPLDPVINDHLGDAFWAVGRETEAQFQWQRALSFDPDDDEAARIRDKLARGLDMVLIDEGAPPLRVAIDND
jgi:tetratricopeptide (TPR) repeat protein